MKLEKLAIILCVALFALGILGFIGMSMIHKPVSSHPQIHTAEISVGTLLIQ